MPPDLDLLRSKLEALDAEAEREIGAARFDLATWGRPYVTATQLADYLCVDRRTVVRMILAAALPAVKAGRCWRIPTPAAREKFHVQQYVPR